MELMKSRKAVVPALLIWGIVGFVAYSFLGTGLAISKVSSSPWLIVLFFVGIIILMRGFKK